MVGLFSPAKELGAVPQRQSAVCVFSVADIDTRFNENIHMCFNGSLQSRNMEYVSGPILDGKCPKAGVIHFDLQLVRCLLCALITADLNAAGN